MPATQRSTLGENWSKFTTLTKHSGKIHSFTSPKYSESWANFRVFRKKYEGKYPRQVPVANFKGNYGTIKAVEGSGKVNKEKEVVAEEEEEWVLSMSSPDYF